VSLFPNFIIHLGGVDGVSDGDYSLWRVGVFSLLNIFVPFQGLPRNFIKSRTSAKLFELSRCLALLPHSTVATAFSLLTANPCPQLCGMAASRPLKSSALLHNQLRRWQP
jgi:hypothetical protein